MPALLCRIRLAFRSLDAEQHELPRDCPVVEVSFRVLDLDVNGEVGNVGAVFGKQVAAIHHTLLRITAEVKFAGGDGSEAAGENAKFSAPSLSTPM
jgi:hypothetical protein